MGYRRLAAAILLSAAKEATAKSSSEIRRQEAKEWLKGPQAEFFACEIKLDQTLQRFNKKGQNNGRDR